MEGNPRLLSEMYLQSGRTLSCFLAAAAIRTKTRKARSGGASQTCRESAPDITPEQCLSLPVVICFESLFPRLGKNMHGQTGKPTGRGNNESARAALQRYFTVQRAAERH